MSLKIYEGTFETSQGRTFPALVFEDEKGSTSFGVRRLRLIVENIEEVQRFIEKHTKTRR